MILVKTICIEIIPMKMDYHVNLESAVAMSSAEYAFIFKHPFVLEACSDSSECGAHGMGAHGQKFLPALSTEYTCG